jgi:hypothetical protein
MQSIKNQHFGKRNNTTICVWTISSSQQIKHDTKSLTRQTAIPASCSNPVLNVEVLDNSSMRETRDKTQEKKIFRRSSAFKNGVDPVWSVRIAEITSPAMPRGPNSRIQQPLRFVERSEVGWRGWDDPDLTEIISFGLERAAEKFETCTRKLPEGFWSQFHARCAGPRGAQPLLYR